MVMEHGCQGWTLQGTMRATASEWGKGHAPFPSTFRAGVALLCSLLLCSLLPASLLRTLLFVLPLLPLPAAQRNGTVGTRSASCPRCGGAAAASVTLSVCTLYVPRSLQLIWYCCSYCRPVALLLALLLPLLS